MRVLVNADAALAALSPTRRQLLALLDDPTGATDLAEHLGLTRQRVNYHLGILQKHGLIEIAETRQRRGFVERLFRSAGPTVIAPDLLDSASSRDDLSADAVVAAASDAIRAVGHLEAAGDPHPTATMVTEVRFESPARHHAFLEEVATLAAEFDAGDADGALAMKVTVLSHVAKGAKP